MTSRTFDDDEGMDEEATQAWYEGEMSALIRYNHDTQKLATSRYPNPQRRVGDDNRWSSLVVFTVFAVIPLALFVWAVVTKW